MADSFAPFVGAQLLCLDMQPGFLKTIPERDQLLRRCSFAISAAQGFGLSIAFTEQAPQKLQPTVPELLSLVGKPIQHAKVTFSALADDGIRDAIKSSDAEHLILCGIETPICVYQTALDALDQNLQVTILSDAVGARRSEDADTCLRALAKHGVYVLPAETVFYSLLQNTKHPFFKGFTELVKKYG